jgi:hypothetical protein
MISNTLVMMRTLFDFLPKRHPFEMEIVRQSSHVQMVFAVLTLMYSIYIYVFLTYLDLRPPPPLDCNQS